MGPQKRSTVFQAIPRGLKRWEDCRIETEEEVKFKVKAFTITAIFVAAAWVYASHPWLGKTLSATQVQQKWGKEAFDETKFKNAGQSERAKMAFSLMTSKKLLGLNTVEIRDRLGSFDGHYFSESYPTYLIQAATKKGEESWQIVFLIDKERKTKEIIVHKNCCD